MAPESRCWRVPIPQSIRVPGFSLHDELQLFVTCGLTPAEALQTATLNPAIFLGRTADLGTIEAGKLADLVLLDANPLDDIANTQKIRAAVVNGRYVDRAALDAFLAEVVAADRRSK
jgi:imidazolonepropionase-like amidohydrolase